MNRKNSQAPHRLTKDTPVQFVKGVGPARAGLLGRLGITTLEDMLYYLPWRYEDRREITGISHLKTGLHANVMCEVISVNVIGTRRMKILEVTVSDGSGTLHVKWFNQPFLKKYFIRGQKVLLSGIVRGNQYQAGIEMENPDFEIDTGEEANVHTARVIPVYRVTEGISVKQFRALMFRILNSCTNIMDEYLPDYILKRHDLKSLQWAIGEIHFPEECDDADALNNGTSPAHKRMIFDEYFLLELGLAMLKMRDNVEDGITFLRDSALAREFLGSLSFEMTAAQKRVLDEISNDMSRPVPMNRLVHGDVGCGKTVVAVAAMLIAVDSGFQACLMAPTELLAEQHFYNVRTMVEGLGVKVILLTSSIRERPLDKISSGEASIVIGTHALIQEDVQFSNLGLSVIDEQHRFGVMQRASLRNKGTNPDVLIMTATPIPRTLAMTLYGDLDISVIDELPPGRRPVISRVCFPGGKQDIYTAIEREMTMGRQIYIVYPLIEESEKLDLKSAIDGAAALQKKFPDRVVGLVHGRMKGDEREAVMDRFKAGGIDILVSTTVIEVGIDVPNASMMLIVHAERFGLAQLHQLRGRIGRGPYDSYCLLLAYPPFSEDAGRRLKAMSKTCDGFRIAEEDLAIRGPGDFFGTRQSGIPEMKIANIVRDIAILEDARREAFGLIEKDPELSGYPVLKNRLQEKWMGRLELVKS